MNDLLPLERAFRRLASERSQFPQPSVNYWDQYKGLLNHLRAHLYPLIDAGLAANSSAAGFYTAHNSGHFDDVVYYAGALLGINENDEEKRIKLHPYELYILLVAIRIHDVGNILGREEHEKKCFHILRSCGDAAGDDDSEKKVIANIAEAHGGKTSDGNKDTIGGLHQKELLGKKRKSNLQRSPR